jgi:uncharacterized protein (TIGR03083 family)
VDREGWIERLAHDGEAMAVAVGRASLDDRVPTCPDWTVRDLTKHLGMVHRWATGYVADRRTEMWQVEDDDIVGTWPTDEELVDWFRTGHRALVRALADADPDVEYWTFLQAPTPLSMWARRQAHETAIHRVDAELVTGSAPGFPPAFAADGIDELLVSFITRRRTKLTADPPRTLRVTTTDTAGDWLVTIGPDGVTTTAGGAADVTITGTASDLYLALWNRRGLDGLDVDGDDAIIDLFRDRVHVRWS